MRDLARPDVLKSATLSAAATALLCLPRFLLWQNRPEPIWYLESLTFLGAIVLWAFVFAWHQKYSKQPVFILKINPLLFTSATIAGVIIAFLLSAFLDPTLRRTTPEDYPVDLPHWLAMTLFTLSFSQLFLIFAPYAWLIRLTKDRQITTAGLVIFSIVVLVLKTRLSVNPLPGHIFTELIITRLLLALIAVTLYLRGGALLIWWLNLLLESRHLLAL